MRSSGVLMHITSLPGPYGVGTMGKEAYAFVDFLAASGQSHWQILPLTPTGFGDSPYQSCSTFAGNINLIDLDLLVEDGLLKQEELDEICWGTNAEKVSYGLLYEKRRVVFRKAYQRFAGGREYDAFCRKNAHWMRDFSLYMGLKDRHSGAPLVSVGTGPEVPQGRCSGKGRAGAFRRTAAVLLCSVSV